ncbi:MAG: TIGR01777 family oxidoreductase [Actinomycetota bacterium]|nr:TIGR01777 family oxidoreductase [Actinomycetota bacterium]MDA2973297.1 TIGR01777 family oxidoreductase [Actinomycetota bacterium]MDA3010022.1 TIGR01777 family oxidoreductase [Actinomycetota bacterium]
MSSPLTIAISGSSGLIGTALTTRLRADGHTVMPMVRTTAREGEIHYDPRAGQLDPEHLIGVDAIVHLAGAGIGDRRWTAAYRREILESRTLSTSLIARSMAEVVNRGGPRTLLSGSGIGFYGATDDQELNERSDAGDGFLADVCQEWEAATSPADDAGIRVAHLRTGIVLSPAGGALKKLLPLFRFGLGGRMGSGRQWQSWISIDDQVGAIAFLLTADISGPVNLTAPTPVTNSEFTKVLAEALSRPALLPIPSFGPRLLLGRDLADALLFTGQRVLPDRLTEAGFSFEHSTLAEAFASLLRR